MKRVRLLPASWDNQLSGCRKDHGTVWPGSPGHKRDRI